MARLSKREEEEKIVEDYISWFGGGIYKYK